MQSITKKWTIAGAAAVMALGMLTACTKTTEKTESGEPVVAEDLPVPEVMNNGEKPKAVDEQTPAGQGGETVPDSAQKDGDRKFHYINEDKDLYGDIQEVGEGKFTVTKIYVEKSENGGEVMTSAAPGAEEESPTITVAYDENTKFIKQKIWDGGARHEEREGSAADLQKGLTAEMNGSYEGDVFYAAEILIVEVILD